MNQVKLKELVSEKKIVVPMHLLKMYKNFNLNIDEFILLIYLQDKDQQAFNPSLIQEDLSLELTEVMQNISSLEDKGLIKVDTKKNDKGILEEIINLSFLYDTITLNILKELNTTDESDLNVHKLIEDEFGRGLSPLEHEMIDEWINNNYSKDLIKEAVKEASMNGVTNLRYIDKILYDWDKKGIKEVKDIPKKEETRDKVEIFNCDWLNEDEEI